jgi:hypothetical protein
MGLLRIALISLVFALMGSCKKENTPPFFPEEIAQAITGLNAEFGIIHTPIEAAVAQFNANGVDTTVMRNKLHDLHYVITYSKEMVYVDTNGILAMVEPAEFYPYQGTDISTQPHVIKAAQTHLPVMSNAFMVVEGYQAAVDVHPVVHAGQFSGTISMVFMPEEVVATVVAPLVAGQSDFEIWVMEKTGLVLYDQDADEIGLNVLTDPLYQDFPELITACEKIASEKSGETQYSFFQTGTTTVITKKTYWDTFYIHGNEWKIVWVTAIN